MADVEGRGDSAAPSSSANAVLGSSAPREAYDVFWIGMRVGLSVSSVG